MEKKPETKYLPVADPKEAARILEDNGFHPIISEQQGSTCVSATFSIDQRPALLFNYYVFDEKQPEAQESQQSLWKSLLQAREYGSEKPKTHKNLEYTISRVDYQDSFSPVGKGVTIEFIANADNVVLQLLCLMGDLERLVWRVVDDLGLVPMECREWHRDLDKILASPIASEYEDFDATMRPIRLDKNGIWFGFTDHDMLFYAVIIARDDKAAAVIFDGLVEEYSASLESNVKVRKRAGRKFAGCAGDYDNLRMALLGNVILVVIADDDIREVQVEILEDIFPEDILYGWFEP